MRKLLFLVVIGLLCQVVPAQNTIVFTDADDKYHKVSPTGFNPAPGTIIQIDASRTKCLKIEDMHGTAENPIIITNVGGQVNMTLCELAAGIELKNCKHVVITGTGDPNYRYGFVLNGKVFGVGITGFSSDIIIENVEVAGTFQKFNEKGEEIWTFAGISAKEDFKTNLPPGWEDFPLFDNLIVRENYIHDVNEGMYLGETKSPGMQMINMKVYNNVVRNTFYEAIQVANTITEVEIFNNFCQNSGIWGRSSHGNLIQLGDNSQGKIYNNILITCPEYGITSFGTGEIQIFNNYIKDNLGIFADDRILKFEPANMRIFDNYFTGTTFDSNDDQVIKYYNQFMNLHVYDNLYDTERNKFINWLRQNPAPVTDENNLLSPIAQLQFSISEDGTFLLDPNGPQEYIGMGPLPIASPTPEISKIILEPSMIQGSWFKSKEESGKVLVDEQNLDPKLGDKPESKYWKPKTNNKDKNKNNKGVKNPVMHLIIDLGQEFYIEDIFLYDLKKEGNVTFSFQQGEDWVELFTDPCKNSNQWNEHVAMITTSSLRLTVKHSYKGRINEIALYGFPSGSGMKSESILQPIITQSQTTSGTVNIYPNPASDWVAIQSSFDDISNEIIDTQGRTVLVTKDKQIPLSELSNGLYFVRSRNTLSNEIQVNRLLIQH